MSAVAIPSSCSIAIRWCQASKIEGWRCWTLLNRKGLHSPYTGVFHFYLDYLIATNGTARKLQYAVSLAMSTAWVWKSVRWVWTMASQNCVQAFHDKMSHMNDMLKPKTTWLNLAKWETSSPHLECYTLPQKICLKNISRFLMQKEWMMIWWHGKSVANLQCSSPVCTAVEVPSWQKHTSMYIHHSTIQRMHLISKHQLHKAAH